MERDELAAWLRLVLTPGLGNVAARRLLEGLRPARRNLRAGHRHAGAGR
jgi:predicted Rossmann fold nucleotide-binding protein DprA/Smf involved in DNA uptake